VTAALQSSWKTISAAQTFVDADDDDDDSFSSSDIEQLISFLCTSLSLSHFYFVVFFPPLSLF